MSALREGTTPARWLQEHPGDSLTLFFTAAAINRDSDQWCVRSTRRDSLADGSSIVRYAYFYPPPIPASLELAADGDPADIVAHSCTLGAVWVESPQSDSVTGRRLAERTREAFVRAYGRVVAGDDSVADSDKERMKTLTGYETNLLGISFFGAAYWQLPGRWELGSATVVIAFDGDHSQVRRPRMLAFAFLPASQFEGKPQAETGPDSAVADSAIRIAGRLTRFDTAMVTALVSLRTREASGSERLGLIKSWLAAARNLAAEPRAAALFVADGVVPVSIPFDDSATRTAYVDLGLKYLYSEADASYDYTHGLLEEALRLDPAGPIGELATADMLDRGFNLSMLCGGGFEQVIKVGEPFLDRLKSVDSRAHAMFVLGDAYADIVALAAGMGGDYADTTEFAARAPSARRKAISYYRQALSLNPKSPRARDAWLEAWRLLAGLPPSTTHFYCVYD